MKKSSLFLIYCLSFVFGIFVADFIFKFIYFSGFYLFIILLFLLLLPIITWRNKKLHLIIFGLFFLLLGLWRFSLSLPRRGPQHVIYYNNQTVELEGQIVAEPENSSNTYQLILGNLNLNKRALKGKLLVKTHKPYNYGDYLFLKCRLRLPSAGRGFNYRLYLNGRGIYSLCSLPYDIHRLNTDVPLSFTQSVYASILKFKRRALRIISDNLSFPASSLASAILFGRRRALPAQVVKDLSSSGLAHIIAISGLHISLIIFMLLNFLIFCGLRRWPAFYLTLIFLFFFLILIGFRASSWRAALLGVAVLLSLQLGRLKQALNLLLFIAVLLLLFNPRLLVADVGFQLSFLAVLGIMYLSEPIKKFLQRRLPFIQTSFLTDILALTLSAQCMVFPLVVYYFGQLSLIAPLANLLVLPLLPAVLVLGFVLVSFGFLSTWLASLVAFVLQPLLNWIIYLSYFLSAWPYGHLQFPGASAFWLFLNYLLLFLVLIRIFFKIYYNLKSDLRGTCPEIRSVKPRVSNN